ncbi:MAG: chloride channel protein [Saprospiraceae bacterium]
MPWELWVRKQFRYLMRTRLGLFVKQKILDNPNWKVPFQAIPLWVASALTGLVAVAYEHLFKLFEHGGRFILEEIPYLIFLTTPLFFIASWALTERFAPNAKGSGIPQLMAAVDLAGTSQNKLVSHLLSMRIALVKIGSSLTLLLGGGAIGREGPTLQISGSIFEMVYRVIPSNWPRVSERIMLITGGASGLAAAFNTPLGGIVYVIEELTKSHIARFRTAVFSAVIIAGMVAQNFLGAYLYLGYPHLVSFPFWMIWAVILIAFISGYAGAGFTALLLKLGSFRRQFQSRIGQVGFILILGLLFATMVFFAGPMGIGSGKSTINFILFEDTMTPWYLFPVRFLGALLSFSVGGAGGIFATSLSSGAALGSWLVGTLNLPLAHHNLLVLVSMIAFLTGVTRTPFTASILVLEMTDRHSAIFYFLLAGIIGNLAAGFILSKSFYEIQKDVYLNALKTLSKKKPIKK